MDTVSKLSAPDDIREFYQSRLDDCQARLAEIDRQSAGMSWWRGLTFLPAVAMGIAGWLSADYAWLWYAGGVIFLAGFVVVASIHETILQQAHEISLRRRMCEVQLARLRRDWMNIPRIAVGAAAEHRHVARDLDLFGRASLFQLVSTAHTPLGHQTLRDWFSTPAMPEEIAVRQAAVTALSQDNEFREELDLRGRLLGAGDDGPTAFLEWAEGPTWLRERAWLTWLARALTAAVVVMVLLVCFAVLQPSIAIVSFLCLIIVNLTVNVAFAGSVHDIFSRVSSRQHDIQHYRPLLEAIGKLPKYVEFFARLQGRLGETSHEPIERLNQLTRIVGIANLRRSGFWGVPYILSQILLMTDFHLLYWLEKWQRRNGPAVRDWLDAIGQLEAIASLARLAHDHPDWTLPQVCQREEATLAAAAIGHPLLPDEACVRNDVEVGPRGTFLLVTGSNMSGKSTLLRAIGVNVVLAQAGGPVCARHLALPPLQIATSMRISDSLADGVSFFMAELKRLKQIVDECRQAESDGQRTFLYLLDEILQGTNSAERHIAVSHVIGHLLTHGAIGAVSTHDLELANGPGLVDACRMVHFRETIAAAEDSSDGQGTMTFDYLVRPGLSPTTNALKLLELVGLARPTSQA